MGNKPTTPVNTNEREKSREIDATLQKDKRGMEKELKLLLLGAGESGKSTFLKQMKMIYGNGFTAADIINYKDLIYTNVVKGLQDLINATKSETSPKQIDPSIAGSVSHILSLRVGHQHKFEGADVEAVKNVWGDEAIKLCWAKRHLYQIYANSDLFFNEIERVSVPDYQPTDTDILKLRMPTTGIVETVFELESYKFRVLDVGGQRSERRSGWYAFQTSLLSFSSQRYPSLIRNCMRRRTKTD